MRILVTGGAGFIGSHIADEFITRGHSVDVLDNLSTGFERNIPRKTRFFKQNIDDKEVEDILCGNKYDIICHFAAQIDVRKSVSDPYNDLRNDVLSSVRLFQWAALNNVKQIIFASSGGAIYGEHDYFPADEEHRMYPESPYGIHKWILEEYLRYFHKQFSMKYSALRYANVYGPRQNHMSEAGVIAIFTTRLLAGDKTIINGNGEQTRDFVYVSDAAAAAVSAVEKEYCGVVNIATTKETSINSVFSLLKKETGSNQLEEHGPPKDGEQIRSVLSYDKAKRDLGWEPKVVLEDGLKKTVAYFRSISD